MDATQRRGLLGRASFLLDLRPEELGFEARWLESAREAATSGDLPRLQALDFGWGSAVRKAEIEDGIGVITIRGPLLEGSYFTDYTDIREAFDAFMEDGSARAVVLDIDSPGGRVAAEMWELAEAIRERREEKPVVAIANDQATSAAYLIAAQAGEVVASQRSAVLGSIGIIATHIDYSGMLKQDGVTVTEVVSGRLKNALSRYKPLSKEGRQLLDELVETVFRDFIDHVEAGRGISEEAIRGLEGGILIGQSAIDANLADRIQSLDDVRARLIDDATQGRLGTAAQNEESSMADPKGKDPKPTKASAAPAKPAAAPDPTTTITEPVTPAAATNVVDINAARTAGEKAGREAAQADYQARADGIRQACELGHCPERFAEFLGGDLSPEAVGKKLLEERAADAGPDLHGQHGGAGGGEAEPVIDTAATYRRWNDASAFATGKSAS